MVILDVQTDRREEFIDITRLVEKESEKLGSFDGICTIFVPHTTAGVTINEHADPSVVDDIISQLRKLIPHQGSYAHTEGNSDAHIKSSMMGHSALVMIEGGKLRLGRWQGIFFCEFDGPRRRKVWLKFT